MGMKVNLAKWGNSAAIRIPKKILEELKLDSSNYENISFVVEIKDDKLILRKKQDKSKFELLAEQSAGEKTNPKIEIDWGNPVGKEVW
jgi:antitoxin MazE